jgi:hypothetical protein
MARKEHLTLPYDAALRRMRAVSCALLGVATVACAAETPTDMTVELPLVAVASVHTGTNGRSFELEMSQEVTTTNPPGDPDGYGTAVLTMNAGERVICWSLTAADIALPATASHIHRAPDGVAGPIVLGLSAPGANGQSSGCRSDVDRDLIVDIFSNPDAYYVNVHTTEHPPGAIRSQLR